MQILALDLGKFKSVSCCFDTEQLTTEYWTLSIDRSYLRSARPGANIPTRASPAQQGVEKRHG